LGRPIASISHAIKESINFSIAQGQGDWLPK